MSDAAKKKAKQRWAIENPKLDNAGQLRGIFFIEPNDEEFKLTSKAARGKLEVPMPAAMPCKNRQRAVGNPTAVWANARHDLLALLMPRKVWDQGKKEQYTNITKIISLKKEWILWLSTVFCTNSFLCLKQWKFGCKGSSGNLAWQLTKVRNKKEVIDEARNKGRKVHFALLMDLCHLKKSELEPQYQKYKGRVVLRGDIAKDDSGSYAVLTDQGSSTSQMTAANVMDIFPDFQDVQVKQPMQYPLIRRSKWKMHQRYWKLQSQNAQIFGYVYQSTNGQHHGPVWKIQSVPLERKRCGHPLAGLLWEWQCEKILLEHGWWKVLKWECEFVNRAKGLILSAHVDDFKMAGRTENIWPTWKFLMKDIDLEEPTSFLDHVHLGCTQRECKISDDIVANYRDMLESRISAGAKEKLPTRASGKPDAEVISSWSYDMEGHAKKCVEKYFELAKWNNSEIFRSRNAMYGWPSIQRRRN